MNSGWNWLATNHGWSDSSTISTSRPSWNVPETTRPASTSCGPILVVHLVAVPVTLVDDRLAVGLVRARAFGELDRLRAEAHRAAEVLDLLLLGQQVDHGMRRLRIHLGRVGAFEAEHVARELGDRDVHAEADAEVRDLALARDAAGEDLSLPAARAEAAGDEHAVDLLEELRRLLERHPLGVDPAHVHRAPWWTPACLSASCTER